MRAFAARCRRCATRGAGGCAACGSARSGATTSRRAPLDACAPCFPSVLGPGHMAVWVPVRRVSMQLGRAAKWLPQGRCVCCRHWDQQRFFCSLSTFSRLTLCYACSAAAPPLRLVDSLQDSPQSPAQRLSPGLAPRDAGAHIYDGGGAARAVAIQAQRRHECSCVGGEGWAAACSASLLDPVRNQTPLVCGSSPMQELLDAFVFQLTGHGLSLVKLNIMSVSSTLCKASHRNGMCWLVELRCSLCHCCQRLHSSCDVLQALGTSRRPPAVRRAATAAS